MLPVISTKKPTEGRRPAVAAIISGEKKSKKRPRAVLPPKSKPIKSTTNSNSNNSSTNNVDLLSGNDIGIDWQQQRQHQHCNNDDDENSLVLAAEAAAALIMGSDSEAAAAGRTIFQATSSSSITPRNGTNNNGILTNRSSLELLENVVASVKVVQDDNDGGTGGIAWGGGEQDSDNYHHYQNPLGPSSHIQIFESKVPNMMLTSSSSLLEMSEKHREFLSQYYGSGGAEQHAVDFLRNDEDEDEEIIEEDVDVAESGRNHTNNIPNKKMSAQVTESSFSEGTMATTITLRAMCKKIPRSTSNKKLKKSNDNQKKGVTFHEGDDVVHLLKTDEDEESNVVDGDASKAASTSLSVEDPSGPQVTVDEHGTIVIAQNSLLPNPENRQSTTEIDQELLGGGSVIDEGETPSQLGAIQARYDSYMAVPRTVPVRWSVRETKDFYNALRQCGTDFSLMQMYCLGRTRAQLKRKFKIESRKNARLVDMALDPKCHVKLDISVFGDSLEIPEEVPTFVREVTPTLPASGGAASSTGSGLAADSNDHHGMRGNYDHLFEEEDEDLALGGNYTSSTAGTTGVAMDSTTLPPGDMFASKSKSNQGRDSLQQPLTILPVVVAAPKMMAKKKMRFKVKPSKKSVK